MKPMSKPVILTGLRANGEFHLGNYLGAILPMLEMQQRFAGEYRLNMFVPDLHSFTTPVEHAKLYLQIVQNLKMYVAAGLDLTDVVSMGAFLSHLDRDWREFDAAYSRAVPAPYPARAMVGATLKGILVELVMVAHARR